MNNKFLPNGKLTYVRTEVRENAHAFYIDVYFADESGKEWYSHSSVFKFDLKEKIISHK